MDQQPNKEQIYDAQINPLMAQIIEVCRQHQIAFVAAFSIPTAEDSDLQCTSAMLGSALLPPANFMRAWAHLRPARSAGPLMLREERADGSVTFTAIVG